MNQKNQIKIENKQGYVTFTAESVQGLSVRFSINGRDYTYDASDCVADGNGRYKVYFNGVNAYEFGDVITISFIKDGAATGATLTYSVDSYISDMYENSNEALADLVKAISNYGRSAADYQ